MTQQVIQLSFYDRLSPDLSSKVKEKTVTVKKLARRMAMDAWVIGKELTEIKESLGNLFDEWLDREFSWSGSTANNFMRVYTAFSENELKNLDFAVTALYALASPNCPDGARKEALAIAQSGKKVTTELGKLIRARNEIAYRPKVGDRVRLGNNSGVVVHVLDPYATVNWGDIESSEQFLDLLPVFQEGDRVQWADNTGTFLKEIGESGQVKFDQIPQGYDSRIQTIHLQLLCYTNSIYVQGSGSGSPMQDYEPKNLNSKDSVNGTNTAEISSNSDTQAHESLETLSSKNGTTGAKSTLLPLHRLVPPSPLPENDSEPTTQETVSPTSSTPLTQSSPNTGPLRTWPDLSLVPSDQEVTNPISTGLSINSPTIKLKDLKLMVQSLDQSSREHGCFLLASPGALSSINKNRAPGQSKHEAQLKKLGLISSEEVVNPRILEGLFGLPQDWTNPLEYRAATELLETAEKHWEIPSTRELQALLSNGSCTSTRSDKEGDRGWGMGDGENQTQSPTPNTQPLTPNPLSVCHSSNSDEHYTPKTLLSIIHQFLGEIDLDPASCEVANKDVQANRIFTESDDGLNQEWLADTLFLNPPYSRIGEWTDKLIQEFELGNFQEALYLVPARTDTKWFEKLNQFFVCFHKGRLKFEPNLNAAPFPSAIFYLGNTKTTEFIKFFQPLGTIRPPAITYLKGTQND